MNRQGKVLLFGSIGVFAILLLISFGLFLISQPKNLKDDVTRFGITNLSKYIKDSDERGYIEWNIYSLAFPGVAEGEQSYVGLVRDGSFNDTRKRGAAGEASFIVDVETVQQSWIITVKYDSSHKILPSGVTADCVKGEDIIYENSTKCIDPSMSEAPSDTYASDPIVQGLPYNGPFYAISSTQIDGSILIVVKIQINHYANDKTSVATFNRHKTASISWLKERNADLTNYQIEWRDFTGTPIDRKQSGVPL